MTKQEKEQAQQELIAEIFAAFEKIDANVEQKTAWIQAKPMIKGFWRFKHTDESKSFPISTISVYYTTYKIMIQGKGQQPVLNCTADTLLEILNKVIKLYC